MSLDVDAISGNFRSITRDTLTNSVLMDNTHGCANWHANYAAYDSIIYFGRKTGASDPPVPGSKAGLGVMRRRQQR